MLVAKKDCEACSSSAREVESVVAGGGVQVRQPRESSAVQNFSFDRTPKRFAWCQVRAVGQVFSGGWNRIAVVLANKKT